MVNQFCISDRGMFDASCTSGIPARAHRKESSPMATVVSSPTENRVAVSATKLLINNRWVNSESGKTFATINPSTGDEICRVSEADAADVDKAAKANNAGR